MTATLILAPALGLLAVVLLAACYWPAQLPDPCPIHAEPCPDPAGCVAVYQAECATHGLPLLATGGEA